MRQTDYKKATVEQLNNRKNYLLSQFPVGNIVIIIVIILHFYPGVDGELS